MNSDGTVRIDIDIPIDQALKNTKLVEDSLSKIGDHVGEGMDDSFEKESNQLITTAEKAKKSANEVLEKPIKPTVDSDAAKKAVESLIAEFKRLPAKTQTELSARAEREGFASFEDMLHKIPKDQATKLLADANNGSEETSKFQRLLKSIPESIKTRLEADTDTEKIKEYTSRLGEAVKASMVFQGVQTGFNIVKDSVHGLISEAAEASDAMDKFNSTMEFAGFGKTAIKAAATEVKSYADLTVYDLGDISNTTAQLAANGIKDYMGLTEAAGNLNAVAGGNADTFKSVAMMMTQTAGAGKLTTENWNQLADAIPGASGKLQEAMKKNGAYTGSFRDAMADGQITADEFNKALKQLGMTDTAKKAAASTATFEGAIGNLQATAVSAFMSIYNAIGKANITKAISAMGDVVSNVAGDVAKGLKALSPVFDVLMTAAGGAFKLLGTFADMLKTSFLTNANMVVNSGFKDFWADVKTNVDKTMTALQPVAKALGGLVGVIAGGVWKTFVDIVSGIAKGFGQLSGDGKGAFDSITGVSAGFKTLSGYVDAMAKPFGEIVGAIGKGVWDGFSGIISAIGKAFKSFAENSDDANSAVKPVKDALEGIAKQKGALEAIGKTIAGVLAAFAAFKTVMVVVGAVTKGISAISAAIEVVEVVVGGAAALIGIPFGALLAIIAAVVAAIAGVVYAFTHWDQIKKIISNVGKWFDDLWKGIKKSWDDFWGGIGSWIGKIAKTARKAIDDALEDIQKGWDNFWGGIGKWVDKVVSDFQKSFDKGWKSFSKWLGTLGKDLSKSWSKIWNPISKWFSEFWDGLVDIVKKFFNGLKTVIAYGAAIILAPFVLLWKAIEKPVVGIFNGITKTITNALNNTAKFIRLSMKTIQDVWEDVWSAVSSFFTKTWNGIVKNTTNFMKSISKAIDSASKWIQETWEDVWGTISSFFGKIWNSIVKNTSNFMKSVSNAISSSIKWIQGIWEDVWGAISSFFSSVWNSMVKFVSGVIRTISNVISSTVKAIQSVWNSVWGAISSFFTGIWNGMVKFFTPIINTISSTISSVIKGIQSTWNSVWGGIGKFFGDIWNGIKTAAQNGINFVIDVIRTGLGAVNGVLGFFGVDKVKLPEHVHFATGGRVNGEEGEFVEINDGGGAHWKEAVQLPNGEVRTSDKRHARGWLPAGSHIFNGEETYQMAQAAGIKHYAGGGDVLKSVWSGVKGAASWVGDKASDVASWIGEKWNAMTDWIAHPVKHVTDLINKSIGGLVNSAPLKWVGQLGQGIFNKAFGGIGSWIKKHLEPIKKKHDEEAESIGSGPMKSLPQLEAIARQAASIMKVNPSDSFIKALANVAMSESGGNAGVANNWDDNAKAGLASVGLLQYIPTTWGYYAMPGHNNRSSTLDNFVTFFNNSDWANSIGYVTYPSWNGMYKWDWRNNGPHGGRRFENGGWASEASIFGEKDGEPEVAINPKRDSADQLILEAISARIKANPASPLNMLKEKPTIYNSYKQPTEKSVDQPTEHQDKSDDNLVDATKVYVQSVVNADGRNIAKAAFVPLSQMLQKGNNAKRGGVVFNG